MTTSVGEKIRTTTEKRRTRTKLEEEFEVTNWTRRRRRFRRRRHYWTKRRCDGETRGRRTIRDQRIKRKRKQPLRNVNERKSWSECWKSNDDWAVSRRRFCWKKKRRSRRRTRTRTTVRTTKAEHPEENKRANFGRGKVNVGTGISVRFCTKKRNEASGRVVKMIRILTQNAVNAEEERYPCWEEYSKTI